MSVQDDSGYVKLVTRLIGVPLELYRGRSPLMGTVTPVPPVPRAEGRVEVRGGVYRARVFTTSSFPDGTLTVALLVPLPPPSLSSVSCGQLRADSWGVRRDARPGTTGVALQQLGRTRQRGAGHQRGGRVRPLRGARARRRRSATSPSHRREGADRRTDPVGVLLARGPAGEGLRGRPYRLTAAACEMHLARRGRALGRSGTIRSRWGHTASPSRHASR